MFRYLFLLLPLFAFSQKTQEIYVMGTIKDKSNTTKSVSFIDLRESKDLGTVTFKGKQVQFIFPKNDAEIFVNEWFLKYNKDPKGNNNIVLVLEKLHFANNPTEDEKNHFTADFRASTFLEKEGQYFFLSRVNNLYTPNQDFPENPMGIALTVTQLFQSLLNQSYTKTPSTLALSKESLSDYETFLVPSLAANKNPELASGIYSDFESFFSQSPLLGYELIRNANNEVKSAKKGEETIPSYKIFAYSDGNKAHLNTAGGFLELEKDDKGFFVTSNEGTLNPAQMNSTYGMFGLIGAGIGAIETSAKNKAARKLPTSKIYIDPLSGKYIYGK
ncbi:hypothetical protein [Chryseobacterium sp. MP_3.2]|uniref:hypothetical protein n=1 Tax=Chryseobacterium sp. MP_3.2 TaxID=3071712 RepID=UPI002DF8871D|nr:hypothetical protein [Chryseobacterium sp. MP_3.2]